MEFSFHKPWGNLKPSKKMKPSFSMVILTFVIRSQWLLQIKKVLDVWTSKFNRPQQYIFKYFFSFLDFHSKVFLKYLWSIKTTCNILPPPLLAHLLLLACNISPPTLTLFPCFFNANIVKMFLNLWNHCPMSRRKCQRECNQTQQKSCFCTNPFVSVTSYPPVSLTSS